MTMDLIKLINEMSFEYEKEEKALKAIEAVFSLVASRDFNKMKKLSNCNASRPSEELEII